MDLVEVLDGQGRERQKNGQLLKKSRTTFCEVLDQYKADYGVEIVKGLAIRGIKLMFSPSFPLTYDDPVALIAAGKPKVVSQRSPLSVLYLPASLRTISKHRFYTYSFFLSRRVLYRTPTDIVAIAIFTPCKVFMNTYIVMVLHPQCRLVRIFGTTTIIIYGVISSRPGLN